jgi:hypothetical protein
MSLLVRRLVVLIAIVAVIAAIWRMTTTPITTQGQLLNIGEIIALLVVALLCLLLEIRAARLRKH